MPKQVPNAPPALHITLTLPPYNVSRVFQVERPGTVAAGAVSVLALIGILVVSTGSIVRSNQGIGSGASGGGPEGSSGNGSRGLPGTVRRPLVVWIWCLPRATKCTTIASNRVLCALLKAIVIYRNGLSDCPQIMPHGQS